jgi:hypothetical protein
MNSYIPHRPTQWVTTNALDGTAIVVFVCVCPFVCFFFSQWIISECHHSGSSEGGPHWNIYSAALSPPSFCPPPVAHTSVMYSFVCVCFFFHNV